MVRWTRCTGHNRGGYGKETAWAKRAQERAQINLPGEKRTVILSLCVHVQYYWLPKTRRSSFLPLLLYLTPSRFPTLMFPPTPTTPPTRPQFASSPLFLICDFDVYLADIGRKNAAKRGEGRERGRTRCDECGRGGYGGDFWTDGRRGVKARGGGWATIRRMSIHVRGIFPRLRGIVC